jgi:hypothetical protein
MQYISGILAIVFVVVWIFIAAQLILTNPLRDTEDREG